MCCLILFGPTRPPKCSRRLLSLASTEGLPRLDASIMAATVASLARKPEMSRTSPTSMGIAGDCDGKCFGANHVVRADRCQACLRGGASGTGANVEACAVRPTATSRRRSGEEALWGPGRTVLVVLRPRPVTTMGCRRTSQPRCGCRKRLRRSGSDGSHEASGDMASVSILPRGGLMIERATWHNAPRQPAANAAWLVTPCVNATPPVCSKPASICR